MRVAVVRGEELLDYAIWRPGAPDGVGDLYRGRVVALMPAMAGVFVSLGLVEGFLPDSRGGTGLQEGDIVCVRVTRAAQDGKGPRLALSEPVGDGPPRLIRQGPGAIERLAALYPEAAVVLDSYRLLAALKPTLGERLSHAAKVFTGPLEAALAALEQTTVDAPGGARLSFHPTPALIAIDVDAASATSAKTRKAVAQLALNRALIPALAQQIRLRNLSGGILVDFAGLSPRRRAALVPTLAAALAADPVQPRLLGFTALGFAEIVRPRIHPPLHELLAGPHATGLAALREAAARLPMARHSLALRAAPTVIRALEDDRVALPDLAHHSGRTLILRSDPSLTTEHWSLEESDG